MPRCQVDWTAGLSQHQSAGTTEAICCRCWDHPLRRLKNPPARKKRLPCAPTASHDASLQKGYYCRLQLIWKSADSLIYLPTCLADKALSGCTVNTCSSGCWSQIVVISTTLLLYPLLPSAYQGYFLQRHKPFCHWPPASVVWQWDMLPGDFTLPFQC